MSTASFTIHEQATLEKLSGGMFSKWQERFFDLDEEKVQHCKKGSDTKNLKTFFEAKDVKSVELDEVKCEITTFLHDGSKKQLKCSDIIEAKKWTDAIKSISPAGVAKRNSEEKAQKEAEEKAQKEAEEKAAREAEEKAKKEAEEKAKKEAEEEAKKEAEEKAKKEAEEKAQREAGDEARKETEEKVKREAAEEAKEEEQAEEQEQPELEPNLPEATEAEAEPADTWGSGSVDTQEVEEDTEKLPATPSKAEEQSKVPALARSRQQQTLQAQAVRPAAGSIGQRSTASFSSDSVFDRLSTSYTGTSKYRRAAVDTNRAGFRGMDGHVSRQSGTGAGGQGSWLSTGMEDTRVMDYDVYSHKAIGTDVRGGSMSKLSVARFQPTTDGGHYCSKADMEEAAQRDIECVDKSTFTQFASTKSQFGTHNGMGMGGKIGRFSRQMTASGHIRSTRDLEDAAKRDFLESDSVHASCFNSTKSLTTKQGMAMGGAVGRFRSTSASGHYLGKRDQEDAASRDFLSTDASAATSTFASAMKKGNPNFSIMGGKTGRFQGTQIGASIYSATSDELGPGKYTADTTLFDKLPMPARP